MDFFSLALAQQAAPAAPLQWLDTVARTPLSRVVVFIAVCTAIRFLLVPWLLKTPLRERTGAYSVGKFFNETLDALVYAAGIVFLVIRPFAIQTFFIPTGSMLETLQINDFIVANKWVYRTSDPKAGDIVVFRPPATAGAEETKKDYIKRCIGVPGQVIEIREGFLYRDGKRVAEQYVTRVGDQAGTPGVPGFAKTDFKLVKDGERYIPVTLESFGEQVANLTGRTAPAFMDDGSDPTFQQRLMTGAPVAVPEGYFLMMGDNRDGSFDSRGWGLVPRRNIIGKAEWIWMPVRRIRQLPSDPGKPFQP